jgi:hypothetical protein
MKLKSYSEVIAHLNKNNRQKHLLLGNGFSMAYDAEIFSYNALNRFIEEIDDDLLRKLFQIINTNNFELVMRQLDNFCQLAEEFSSDKDLKDKIQKASDLLKTTLIDAVKKLHPEHVFQIPENKSESCAIFLNTFLQSEGHIFTTNYDVLLYWVLMRNKDKISSAVDGFGREAEEGEDIYSADLEWGVNRGSQNIHYLHGALPLFDAGVSIVKEEYDGQNLLLEKINKRIDQKEYPIFVTGGNGKDKLTHILHNPYLDFCYDKLCNIEGSLITFGFNFGEYDEHIIEAINIAAKNGKKVPQRLWSVHIGVYSDEDKKHIDSIASKFKCKVNTFDSKTALIWDS